VWQRFALVLCVALPLPAATQSVLAGKISAQGAQYREDGMDVAADAIHDAPTEKWRSTNSQVSR
jgi:hypothetical protein